MPQFCVLAADSSYSQKTFLLQQVQHEHLVTVVRVRSNRVFYQSPATVKSTRRRGRPRWYGERFDLKNETTWHPPAQITQSNLITYRGHQRAHLTVGGVQTQRTFVREQSIKPVIDPR